MRKKLIGLLVAALACGINLQAQEAGKDHMNPVKPVALVVPLDKARVQEIVQLLPEKPAGLGKTYKDRASWDKLKNSGKYAKLFKEVNGFLTTDFPVWDEEGYMGMFTKGDSQTGKDVLTRRLRRLIAYTWAECLDNKGKYVPAIEASIKELINQKTWVNPRNYSEKNYRGLVELSTASYAHNLAQAIYLLDDKLNPETRKAVIASLYQRAFNPLLATVEGKNKDHGWLTSTNNWNAVCLAGTTGAALTVLPSREERARFVAMSERYTKNFIAGFLEDGYCTEGLGYYNYGFSRFVVLREAIFQATNGKLDLFDTPKIRKMAAFLPNMEIINGVYPAIGDCRTDTKPSKWILYYVNRNLGMGLTAYDNLTFEGETATLYEGIMSVFPNTASQSKLTAKGNTNYAGLRSFFDQAGVLTVRPKTTTSGSLAAVLKGGKNNEHHNHNDLGSFNIVVGDELLMGDPGIIPYTAKTFGPDRYTYKSIDSYGHPVPFIAQHEQEPGGQAEAKIIRTDFTDGQDKLEMDLTSAYEVKELEKLNRLFSYDRSGKGSLEVQDDFQFTNPQLFETALITRVKWKQTAPNQLLLEGERGKMLATIQAPAGGFTVKSEEISEEGGLPYTRIAIALKEPIAAGTVKMQFKPVEK